MKTEALMNQIQPAESVEDVLELARFGPGVQATIRPRLDQNPVEPGRLYPSFRLAAVFTVKAGARTASFEKTYAKGHEVQPAKAAANGFLIANTRMQRDVKRLRQAGVKCDVVPFVLSQLLPGTDLSEFEPRRPYYLNQFAILASIGVPIQVSMTTGLRRVTLRDGRPGQELCAFYTIHCQSQDYQLETHHGCFPQGADKKLVDRLREQAENYLFTEEQHNFRRVGVEIQMGPLWKDEKSVRLLLAPQDPQSSEERSAGQRTSQGLISA
jgi:hypothetical protein